MDPMEWLLKNRIGSLELSRQAGPNLLRGLAGSVVLHGLVVATFVVMALLNGGKPAEITIPGRPITLIPPSHPYHPLPPIRHDIVKATPPNPVGKPVPVIDEPPVDPTVPLNPAKPGIPGPIDVPGTYFGNLPVDTPAGTIDTGTDIPGDWIFIPHEFEPQPLSINPQPEYPELAKLSGMMGKVTARMWVDAHGNVLKWAIVKANPKGYGFEDEVTKVIPKWKFAPALQQGKPVGVWISIPFTFTYQK